MHEISKLKSNDATIYQEGVNLLKTEATEDERSRSKHGTDRWTRQPSGQAAEKLYAQVGEIDGYLKSAASSDELVKSKLKECESAVQILEGTDRDLEAYVPSSRRAMLTPGVERAADNLRSTLSDVSKLEHGRKRKVEEVREKFKRDDINSVILKETARFEREYPMQKIEPAQFENLFDERLERYEEEIEMVSQERESQAQLSTRIQEANATFSRARTGDSSTKEREQALQRLENAYFKYKEIVSNLNTGRKFYNDLAPIVTRFTDSCRDFAYQRRVEAGQMETELSTALSNLNLNIQDQKERHALRSNYAPQQASAQQQQSYHQQQEEQKMQPPLQPMTAPTPTRAPQPEPGVWHPAQGIKFGVSVPGAPAQGGQQSQQHSGNVHNPAYPNANVRAPGQWDVSHGVRFG
ncbi:MAG: hypothetical protein Q9174_006231 [Haloplaca sp. 1 TL-2023]